MDSTKWKHIQIQDYNTNWYYKKNRFAFLNRLNIVKRFFTQFSPKLVLDIGTADGEIPYNLITGGKLDSKFIGIDISKELIHIARKIAKKNKYTERIQYVVADLEYLPFQETIFDSILCTAVLEHIFNPEIALKELARICKDEKFVMITVPNFLFYYFFQILSILRLRYKDSNSNSRLKMKNLKVKVKKYQLKPIYKLNFVLPIPKFLNFFKKFLIRLDIRGYHLFLNQLLICKKE